MVKTNKHITWSFFRYIFFSTFLFQFFNAIIRLLLNRKIQTLLIQFFCSIVSQMFSLKICFIFLYQFDDNISRGIFFYLSEKYCGSVGEKNFVVEDGYRFEIENETFFMTDHHEKAVVLWLASFSCM